MDRKDSGFDQSYHLKATETDLHSVQRSNTISTCRRKSRKDAQSPPCVPNVPMTGQRPSSEHCSRRTKRRTDPRRPSIGSSSDDSTKSRARGYASKSSSRRTSVTIVDPSRPARHYRITSSQSVPTAQCDVDDVLALHFRSCSLFQNPSIHSRQHSGNIDHVVVDAQLPTGADTTSVPTPLSDMNYKHAIATSAKLPTQSEETVATAEVPDTVHHWISPSTRRREYERIDKQNSGIRGIVRRIAPRCVSGPTTKFYEKDTADTCSVRRYRMDLDEDEKLGACLVDEKNASSLRLQSRKVTRKCTEPTTKKKWWGCF